MYTRRSVSFLLILAVGSSIAETVQNDQQEYSTLPESVRQLPEKKEDTKKLDYESALRPAVMEKRSIANIARLLLGGSVPLNHPLVKYPEPKAWNLANNIVAALNPSASSSLLAAASTQSEGWGRQPGGSALQNLQQLFETKAKIIPYTGQVATGLTGLASVKGDLIRQIHSISTQAIAQAAAEAAARALASAAAAHAVTNTISNSVNHGAQVGIKGGWSSYQSIQDAIGKTPGEQPGPPYYDSSAHINHYQPPPQQQQPQYNPYPQTPHTTPTPPIYPPQQPYQNAYPQQQQAYPQQQNAYQAQQQQQQNNQFYTLYNTQPSVNSAHLQTPYTPAPPVPHARPTLSPNTLIATTPSAPASIFGRNAAQPSSSLLSTISSLLSASSAAYNAAFTGSQPRHHQQQHQQLLSPSILSALLPSASSTYPFSAAPSILRPATAPAPSILTAGIAGSSAYGNGFQQQPARPNYSGIQAGYYQPSGGNGNPYYQPTEARTTSVHPSSYTFNPNGAGNLPTNYAQSGANPYAAQSVQSAHQFASPGGSGSPGYPGQHPAGSGYPSYNVGTGPSPGPISGWNPQHAGSSPSAASWPTSGGVGGGVVPSGGNNFYQTPGHPNQTPGNFNNPSGSSYPGNYQVASGGSSVTLQPSYSAPSPNSYQSPTSNPYAAQQQYPQNNPSGYNPHHQHQSSPSNPNSIGGIRNSNLISHRHDDPTSTDQRQSASTMGNEDDYENDNDAITDNHHSHQQSTQQRHHHHKRPSTKNSHSSSHKKRPQSSKRPSNPFQRDHPSKLRTYSKPKTGSGPPSSKKGSHFDSSSVVDASVDESAVASVDHYFSQGDDWYSSHQTFSKNKPDKNRWRFKNPVGQEQPHAFHDHDSNDGRPRKKGDAIKTSAKNEPGSGSERTRPQVGQSKGQLSYSKGYKSKQGSGSSPGGKKWGERTKTEAAKLYRGRIRQQQKPGNEYKSRDVYSTLPEYVFRVDERKDVFVRPSGGGGGRGRSPLRGRGDPARLGETDGRSSPSKKSSFAKKEENIYDEGQISREDIPEKSLEKSTDDSNWRGSLFDAVARGRQEEESDATGETTDEAEGRSNDQDVLRDHVASESGFIASEEFDPEEREAFVDDVYSDNHNHHHRHHSQKRQDYQEDDEERDAESEQEIQQSEEEDSDKKK